MRINLKEIPEEGQSWSINRKTAELNEALRDLIAQAAYEINFSVRPLAASATYELRGTVKTELPEECSRCALDFHMPIDTKFNNLLMPAMDTPRDAKFSKANHFTDLNDSGLEVAEYVGTLFDAGEFFHELVALAEPFNPAPAEDKDGNCSLCKISLKNKSFSYDEELEAKQSPFATLKGIKFNS